MTVLFPTNDNEGVSSNYREQIDRSRCNPTCDVLEESRLLIQCEMLGLGITGGSDCLDC